MGLFDLFRPNWKHSDPDVRIEAIGQVSDAAVLQQMAAADSEWFVRHRALDAINERFAGQQIYAYLAKHSQDEEIRRKVVKKLTDEQALGQIAANDKYRYVRDAAEHRLDELRQDLYGEKAAAGSSEAQPTG